MLSRVIFYFEIAILSHRPTINTHTQINKNKQSIFCFYFVIYLLLKSNLNSIPITIFRHF